MGIGFNATFLIQIIHFFVAYVLFHRILFKPALAVIDRERTYVNQLNAQIDTDRALLEERRAMQRQHWLAVRNYFKSKLPMQWHVPPMRPLNSQEVPDMVPSKVTIENQSTVLAQILVKRMESQ